MRTMGGQWCPSPCSSLRAVGGPPACRRLWMQSTGSVVCFPSFFLFFIDRPSPSCWSPPQEPMRRCLTATPTRPAPFRTPPGFWELLWLCKMGPASLCGGGLIPTCWRVPEAEGASLLWFTFPYLRVSSFGGTLCIVRRPTLLFHFIAVYMRRKLRERRGCSTWMVRTRSRSGGIVPIESGESFFIAASPAPLRATAKLFVKETWNHVLTIHRTLLHWATPSPPPAGTAAPAATTPPHSSASHTVPALSTDDNPVAARGGAGGAETAAVGAAAQADTAGRRDSGVGTGASADTGDAGRPADCPLGIAGGRCGGGDEACGWPAFVDLAVAPPTRFTNGAGRGHPQADHAPPCRRGD